MSRSIDVEWTQITHLDEDVAFRAMCAYVEAYWERGLRSSDDIAQLLSIMHDDPAIPNDWADAVDQVVR